MFRKVCGMQGHRGLQREGPRVFAPTRTKHLNPQFQL